MERVVCVTCKSEGRTSRIHKKGSSRVTLVHYPGFYDEEGRFHLHDSNVRTESLRCSNGHEWTERSSGRCWCGWVSKVEKERSLASEQFRDRDD